ncbi:MAG: cation:proton antiporter [Nitrospinae bacterium]|nr:cation:proton antiporter [Nitrospinota bacterium]
MDTIQFFLNLIFIILSAKLLAEIFSWLKFPAVLGELLAGVLIGPSVLGLVQVDGTLLVLAEIGILLLLFQVGLETDVAQLLSVGKKSVAVAATGIVVPALLAYFVSIHLLGYPFTVSLFIGGTLVATSIGISLRVLMELNRQETNTAKIVLGAAVLDDIAGVLILTLLFDFAVKQDVAPLHTAVVFGYILAFLFLAPILANLLVPVMARANTVSRTQGLVPTLAVSLILGLAVISHSLGAPAILGAFAAGIALSRHFYIPAIHHRLPKQSLAMDIEKQMKPIIDLFVPIFFFVVGASINLGAIDFSSAQFWIIAGTLTVVAVAGKVVSGIWAEGDGWQKLFCGMAMVPRGEVGLIFAEVGRKNGILDETVYAIIVFVVALTTFIAPLAMRMMSGRIGNGEAMSPKNANGDNA